MHKALKYSIVIIILIITLTLIAHYTNEIDAAPCGIKCGKVITGQQMDSNTTSQRYGLVRAWVLVTLKGVDVDLHTLAASGNLPVVCSTSNAGAVILKIKIKQLGGIVVIDSDSMFYRDMLEKLKAGQCVAAVMPHKYTETKIFTAHFKIAQILTGNKQSPDYVLLQKPMEIATPTS